MAHKKDEELGPKELARRQYQRAYRAAHAEHLAQQQRKNYAKNRVARRAWGQAYYQEHAEEYRARAREQRRVHKEYFKGYWRERNTGCSPALYTKLLEEQDSACAICRGTDERNLCADHDHASGAVRGLLCRNCNLGIGNMQHDVNILRRAIVYLTRGLELTR